MKASKAKYYMGIAEAVSLASHDTQTKVGGILVKGDGAVVATSFNGFVRGAPDSILPTTRPDKYVFIQHCELNLLTHCARHGISTDNTTCVITLTPCVKCIRLLHQAGINDIIAKTAYSDFEESLMLPDVNVIAYISEDTGFINLTIRNMV